jgi:hypothetical protein
MEAARRRIAEDHEKLPLELQPVRYIAIDKDTLVPAQIDPKRKIELRWRGVRLKPSQVPGLGADGSFGIVPIAPTGYTVTEVEPPVRYYLLAFPNRYCAGYYDATNAILFQWHGIEFGRSELAADPDTPGFLLDPGSFEVSSIIPPKEFTSMTPDAAGQRVAPPTAALGPLSPATTPIQPTPAASSEWETAMWPWVFAIASLVAILALARRCRSRK